MKKVIFFILCVLTFSACGTATTSTNNREKNYGDMYSSGISRNTILIMPPINRTVNVDAKEYFYSSLSMPLCEKGYYVISPYLALETLKNESAYDSELFINGNLSKFHEVFGADLALFTIIDRWDKSALGHSITVEVEYILKSTTANKELFHRRGIITVDTGVQSNSAGLFGALVDMAASAINTAATDKVIAARSCNAYVLSDLPCGPYSDQYNKDQNFAVGDSVVTANLRK